MDKQTIGKIASACLALGIIITAGIMAIHEVDWAEAAFWAGIGIAGGLGTALAPRLREPRPDGTPPSSRRGRGTPPLPVLALTAIAASGCGGSALSAQADAALLTSRTLAEGDAVLVGARARALDTVLDDARRTCGGDGCTDAQATALRARLTDLETRWEPVMRCREPVVQGVRAWIDAIEDAHLASSDELGWSSALAWGARALLLYAGFAECVESASGGGVDLPELPMAVTAVVQGAAR